MTVRTALVTGGTGAIGQELCKALHAGGYRVVANCYPGDEENARGWIATGATRASPSTTC